jgi:hypothetical protein
MISFCPDDGGYYYFEVSSRNTKINIFDEDGVRVTYVSSDEKQNITNVTLNEEQLTNAIKEYVEKHFKPYTKEDIEEATKIANKWKEELSL